tara:strand:- start:3220 stop:6492 length:3273 start_codon:yes stop_codon:yes gene_type:complete
MYSTTKQKLSGYIITVIGALVMSVLTVPHADAQGLANRAVQRLGNIGSIGDNGPGYTYYGINGADRGLGYVGSYATVGGFIPTLQDDFGGIWNADLRGHYSVNGGFFSNVGAVRKQLLNGGSLLGLGIYWDYDGDLFQNSTIGIPGAIFGQFGHVYQQVGISGEYLTDWGNIRSNGYIPVGRTGNQLSTHGTTGGTFYQHYILGQNGLSAALGGADFELGAYVPALADWAGMINVGGYTFGNTRYTKIGGDRNGDDLIPFFGGVYTRLDLTFARNWDFSLQYNNDSFFDSTGFARLTYRMGGSRRRNVPDQMEQPMFRNEHIVRANETPMVAFNPTNNNEPWQVVHVDNTALPGGNGTIEAPVQTLAAAQIDGSTDNLATQAWTITYVHQGNATSTFDAYTDEFRFRAPNQFLVGSGGPLTIGTQPINGSTLLTIGALTAGNPVLSNQLGASVLIPGSGTAGNPAPAPGDPTLLPIAGPAGGATVANLSIIGSQIGIDASGDLSNGGLAQPIGTTSNPFGSAISAGGGSSVRNVAITGNGTSSLQRGVRIAQERDPISPPNDPPVNTVNLTTVPAGGIEFSDTAISLTTAQAFQVGLENQPLPAPPAPPTAIAGSGGDVDIDYYGSISNNINQNGNFETLLISVAGRTGGTINLAATSAPPQTTIANQILDIGGQGILILENAGGTTNIGNVTLADSKNTAIFVQNDQSTTNITTIDTSTYAYGITKSDGDSAIFINQGTPTFNFFGTIQNAPPASGNNFITDIRNITGGDINITGPGTFPLNDSADGVFIDNAQNATIAMTGLSSTGNGTNGILVQDSTSIITFTDTRITGAATNGILLDSNSGAAAGVITFENTFINLTSATNGIHLVDNTNTSPYLFSNTLINMGAAGARGVLLENTGPTEFTNLRVLTQGTNAVSFESLNPSGTQTILVSGASQLTNLSTSQPAILVDANDVTMTFDTISSAVPQVVTDIETGDVPDPTTSPNPDEITNLTDTTTLRVGMTVSGTNIPAGATIASIDSATQITLSTPVIAGTGTVGDTLTFTGPGIAIDFDGTPSTSLDIIKAFEVGGVPGTADNTIPDGVTITLP